MTKHSRYSRSALWLVLTLLAALAGCAGKAKIPDFANEEFQQNKTAVAKRFVEVERPKHLKKVQRVVIPEFRVEFVTRAGASHGVGTAVGDGRVSVSTVLKLKGLDQQRLQTITDKLYADLVQQLTAQGIEVIPLERLQNSENWRALMQDGRASPQEEKMEGPSGTASHALVFSPTGIALPPKASVKSGFADLKKAFSGKKVRSQYEGGLMEEFSAALLKARYVAGFAHFQGKTKSFDSVSLQSELRYTLVPEVTQWAFYPEIKRGSPSHKNTRFYLSEPVVVSGSFVAESKESTPASTRLAESAAKLFSFAAALATGTASGSTSKHREYDVIVDDNYARLSERTLPLANELFITRLSMLREGSAPRPAAGAPALSGLIEFPVAAIPASGPRR